MTGVSNFYVVVGEFGHWEGFGSITLLIVDQSREIGFYCTVLSTNLAVSLRVKDSGEPLLDF